MKFEYLSKVCKVNLCVIYSHCIVHEIIQSCIKNLKASRFSFLKMSRIGIKFRHFFKVVNIAFHINRHRIVPGF